jgi:hypothetical protein
MEDLRQKSIFPETITLEEAVQRSFHLYMCMLRAINRMLEEKSLTEDQSENLMLEVREYVAELD